MVKKKGVPEVGELVICRISKINPHSAFALMEEYDIEGMVHISEITSGWVRDIRQFVKTGETKVARVLSVDDRGRVSLSLKRVGDLDKNRKMKSYRMEHRAEKMLELAAQMLNKKPEEAYKEVGSKLMEGIGSLYEGFLAAMQKPDSLLKMGIPEKWIAVLKEIAEKNIEQKEFEFKAKLAIKTFKPAGIYVIKSILSEAEKMHLKVHYIAAPSYFVKYSSKNAKKGEKEFQEKLNKLAENKEADVSFVIA
ncbi:MAG: S1 RNA-binding domain-containing protein [Candidatus Aenigmarchaeota archaeon]|nr:S1 RNA-binding domain-containing protein [Candidatus Aenigmarchaeota archaeon]